MPNGIDAGDAVVSFLADTTQLDAAFDKVGAEGTVKLAGADAAAQSVGRSLEEVTPAAEQAGEAMAEAGKTATFNMMEAKGAIMLTGEEIGIRMPRHLQRFVANLPGVGVALSQAFNAIAVLFLLQIIVEGAKKLSEFTAELMYGVKGAEANMEATKDLNKELLELSKQYGELKQKVDDYGKSQVQLAEEAVKKAKQTSKELKEQLKEEEDQYFKLTQEINNNGRARLAVSDAWARYRAGQLTALEALTAVTVGETQQVLHGKELAASQTQLIKTNAELKVAQEETKVAVNQHTDAVRKQQEEYARLEERYERVMEQLRKAEAEFKKLATVAASEMEPSMTIAASAVQRLGAALRALGNDNVDIEMQAKKALSDMDLLTEAYRKNQITVRQYALAKVAELNILKQLAEARGEDTAQIDKQITAYEKMAGTLKQTDTLWDAFASDFKKKSKDVGNEGQVMGHMLGQTVSQMDTAFASAIMGAITSGASIGAALEQATKAILSNLASQALAKAMYYTAEGIAAAATGNPAAAGYFAAAGEFAGVAALAGVAASVMGGGGGTGAGGSGGPMNTNQGGAINPISVVFGGSGPNVKKFADGGLISGTTLAMMGEGGPASAGNRPQEAAIPLDNPEAVSKIKEALGGGGGDTHHWHVRGLVSPDTLSKVADQMSAGVKQRKINLYSTNSFRIQRRST